MSLFSDRLRALRERNKKENSSWTQEFVADKIGVARVTYTAYEKGTKQPPMETIANIANLLNTNTDYLYGLTEDDSPSKKTTKESYTLETIDKAIFNEFMKLDPKKKDKLIRIMEIVKEE